MPLFAALCSFSVHNFAASTDPNFGVGQPSGTVSVNESLSDIRRQYVEAVERLGFKAAALESQGVCAKEIARTLVDDRRAIGQYYRSITPEPQREKIARRNLRRYGDEDGPSFRSLLEQAHGTGLCGDEAYNYIVSQAQRTNPHVNRSSRLPFGSALLSLFSSADF